jgi:hypothetical protein
MNIFFIIQTTTGQVRRLLRLFGYKGSYGYKTASLEAFKPLIEVKTSMTSLLLSGVRWVKLTAHRDLCFG